MTLNPRSVGNLRFLAASLAASGQFKEARESAARCCGPTRASAPPRSRPGHAFKDADERRLFGEHLVLARLPE